jgi:hypothetical protein
MFQPGMAGNVTAIVALLPGAAVTGHVTAWYYAKSLCLPVVRGLEADR